MTIIVIFVQITVKTIHIHWLSAAIHQSFILEEVTHLSLSAPFLQPALCPPVILGLTATHLHLIIYIASLNMVVATLSPAIAMPTVARSAAAVAVSVVEGAIVAGTEDGREVAGDIIMDIYEAVTVFLANFATD
uniref:hypothetical protein n=1 Tax=Prevotella sp. TaxID=59823 RepID=UPI00402A58C2